MNKPERTSFLKSIGPAMIIAAVVCGPGSILTSSKIGAQLGYSAVWVLALACVLMIAMVALAARIGSTFEFTPCQEIANRIGRPAAMAIGIAMFLIIAAFQSSNNIAIGAALEAFNIADSKGLSIGLLLTINAAIILFLYTSRDLYGVIEKVMKALVFLMMVAFLLNCIAAKPSISLAVKGLIPSNPGENVWLLIALMGTTFSVAAAFYQGYLVREKNWTESDRRTGMIDSVIGVMTLCGISLVIMMTSASIFHGNENVPELKSAADVALQLNPLFGTWAQYVFGIGILAGALSSFLVNAMIGGHILSDGFGLGDKIKSSWTKHFTTLALLAGMAVALLVISTDMSRVTLIVCAQALTVIGFPALALSLIYLGIVKRRENKDAIPVWIMIGASVGFVVTCLMAVRTVSTMIATLSKLATE